jgi:hypothetical protein
MQGIAPTCLPTSKCLKNQKLDQALVVDGGEQMNILCNTSTVVLLHGVFDN